MVNKRFLAAYLAVVVGIALALIGCSSNSEQHASNSSTTAETLNTQGTLIIARKADATTLDPHFITNNNTSNYISMGKVYEGLVQRDQNMKFLPALATEWKQLNDVTWEFKLRQGVTFHDGTPFNAQAVQKTFARILDKNVGSSRIAVFAMVKEIKAIDDYTVQFVLDYPYAPLLASLAINDGSIISPKAIEQYGKDLAKHPVGTGPFSFESWTPGQEMVLVRNENYWGEKSKIAKVIYKIVPEDTTRTAMVETGEAHLTDQVPVSELARVQSSPSIKLLRTEGLGIEWLDFNVQKKPFDDVRVRQAIAHAIDKEAIIKGVYNDVGRKAVSTLSPKVVGYHPTLKDYDYDVNKAKALLAEAGYPNGFTTSIMTGDQKERVNLAEVIQAQLKEIGIDVEVKSMEYGAYLAAAGKGEHEMTIGSWGNATGDGDSVQWNIFHSSSFGDPGNHAFYANAEVDMLIEAGRRESDPVKRDQIYAKLQEIEWKDAPVVPIRIVDHLAIVSEKVKDFSMDPIGFFQLNKVTVEE